MAHAEHDSDYLAVSVADTGSLIVVLVTGEIDVGSGHILAEPLFRKFAEAPPTVVIDLTHVSFIGSEGLAILTEARRKSREASTDLRIVATKPSVLRVFEISGLMAYLPVYLGMSAALQGVWSNSPR